MNDKRQKRFFNNVFDDTLDPAPTYPKVRQRTQSYVVLGKKNYLLVDFNKK